MHERTITELSKDLAEKKFSSLELTEHFINRIKKYDTKLNSFITITEEHAINQAKKIDAEIAKNKLRPLSGIPIAQKDIFCMKNIKTTCGSKMLENFISPYDSTVVKKLNDAGSIVLDWVGGTQNVIDYNIYRDGTLYDTSTVSEYIDNNAVNDIEYCYTVSANYPSGESESTNQSCTMWILAGPLSITATGGNGFIEVEWLEPGVNSCADEVIPSLPFNTLGTNVGMGNDWTVQGSEGEDYAYLLIVTSPIVIDVTLCSMSTDYDSKLEIFTADQECVETTTGYYIDDATCEFSSLQSTLLGVSLEPGQYYIVVDGYGGGEGDYEINVTQSA